MKALPERPHLDHLKKQAKALLDGVRRGDPASLERLRLALPAAAHGDHAAIAAMQLRLHDAQSCVAREYGFDSWTQLKDYVELQAAAADAATRKQQWRKWAFGHGYQVAKPRLAERLLHDHPDLLSGEPALACAVGDVVAVRAAIAADPAWVNAPHAGSGMPPLACASFSGMVALPAYAPGIRACVDLLLEAGADANVRWIDPQFPDDPLSALYGAAGRNHDVAITQRLLAAGADPNDHESLYHATEAADPAIVRLLLEAGARVAGCNALFRALDYERPETLRLLLAHGGDPNEAGPSGCPLLHAIRRRRSDLEEAILLGTHCIRNVHNLVRGDASGVIQQTGGTLDVALPCKVDRARQCRESGIHDLTKPLAVFDLNGVVGRDGRELVDRRRDLCDGGVVFVQILLLRRQEMTPCRAFRAAHFKQDRRYLVFNLDGVNNPAVVFARLVDQKD